MPPRPPLNESQFVGHWTYKWATYSGIYSLHADGTLSGIELETGLKGKWWLNHRDQLIMQLEIPYTDEAGETQIGISQYVFHHIVVSYGEIRMQIGVDHCPVIATRRE